MLLPLNIGDVRMIAVTMPKWPREHISKTDRCDTDVERATSMAAVSSHRTAKCQMFLEVFQSKVDFCWSKNARLKAIQREKDVTLKTVPLTSNGQYLVRCPNVHFVNSMFFTFCVASIINRL